MSPETRICQNCKQNFTIWGEDFGFYEKMKVPAPTFCPDCRRQRRFAWRNERTLYKRKCDLCKKDIIGLYPQGTKFPVYCHDCWFSDNWDPFQYGADYDFSKPFFKQFKQLGEKVPRLGIWIQQCTNSEYTNQSYSNKNVYLSFALRDTEDSAYCCRAVQLKHCFDDTYTHHSEFLYSCVDTDKSYRSRFLEEAEGCVESGFLSNARNCQNCIGGVNLRAKSNMFFGEQLSKEGYQEKLKTYDLGSRKTQNELLEKLRALKEKSIFRFANLINTANSTGDHLSHVRNCRYVFDGFELENARYSSWVFSDKEVSDCYGMGGSEFIYEAIGVEEVNNMRFCSVCNGSSYVEYGDLCSASQNLFGCVGLRNKEYCILNKKYSKESFDELRKKIIEQMKAMPYKDQKGRAYGYGEFFPAELSPFAYNETIAQEAYPLSKTEIESQGYLWRAPEERNYAVTLSSDDVPGRIQDVNDTIVNETISCAHKGECNDQCSKAFRIALQELQFYKLMRIPLPVLCSNCRHYERLRQRNPVKLWHRKCQCAGAKSENGVYTNTVQHQHDGEHCANEFETSYAPERKEIVYCERCYQAEVV